MSDNSITSHEGSKYLRTITSPLQKDPDGSPHSTQVDVYAVLKGFDVTCPAIAHAIKKLLMPGTRGKGDKLADLKGAQAAINRAIELEQFELSLRGEYSYGAPLAVPFDPCINMQPFNPDVTGAGEHKWDTQPKEPPKYVTDIDKEIMSPPPPVPEVKNEYSMQFDASDLSMGVLKCEHHLNELEHNLTVTIDDEVVRPIPTSTRNSVEVQPHLPVTGIHVLEVRRNPVQSS